jgi:hypothetical protein
MSLVVVGGVQVNFMSRPRMFLASVGTSQPCVRSWKVGWLGWMVFGWDVILSQAFTAYGLVRWMCFEEIHIFVGSGLL